MANLKIGNFSIFKRLEEFFKTGKKLPLPTKEEKVKWLKQHAKYSVEFYGEKKGIVLMRKVVHYYVKDMPNAAKIRSAINVMTTLEDIEKLFFMSN